MSTALVIQDNYRRSLFYTSDFRFSEHQRVLRYKNGLLALKRHDREAEVDKQDIRLH